MPNVLGKQIETAQAVLSAAGFTQVTPVEVESNEEKGLVLSQSVKENQEVDVTVQIILEVSAGPEETEPPLVEKRVTLQWDYESTEEIVVSLLLNGEKVLDDQIVPAGTRSTEVVLTGNGIQKYTLVIDGGEFEKSIIVDFTE